MKKIEVEIVETLRRRVVVECPDAWTETDAYEFVWSKYSNDGDIVLTAEDFDTCELFTHAMPDGCGTLPDYVVAAGDAK